MSNKKTSAEQVISDAIAKVDTPYNHSIEGENAYGRGYCDGLAVALYIISTNQKKAQPFYPPKEYTENKDKWEKEERKKEIEKKRVFGDGIVGDWICANCHYHVFPHTLCSLQDDFVWTQVTKSGNFHPCCPKCSTTLQYDEAETLQYDEAE